MSLRFTEEQTELRRLVRRFLEAKSPSGEVRRLSESDVHRDDAVWWQMAGQLGLMGLAVPEEFGGAGYGTAELGIVVEEMGRALLVAPYFSTVVLAAQALVASGDESAKQRWLPLIAGGSLTATLAIAEGDAVWAPASTAATAVPSGDAFTVTGTKAYVLDGHTAQLLLVVAREGGRGASGGAVGVYAVDGDAPGVTREKLDGVDRTRDLARVVLTSAPAVRIGGADALPLLDRLRDLVLTASASEQIGGASRCLETAVEYAKVREQFGQPIGAFQAIKHKCADMLLEIESGKAAAYHAASLAGTGDPETETASALAAAYCAEAYVHAAKENIQIHGGIGYTWEHDAHLHLKRATSSRLFGAPAEHRVRLAALIGL